MSQNARLNVWMTPDYTRDNPYQRLLAGGLAKAGVDIMYSQGFRRGLPITRGLKGLPRKAAVLHLHWHNPYVIATGYLLRAAKARTFCLDLQLAKRQGVPLVWTVHNLGEHDSAFPKLELGLNRRLGVLADQIILHSQSAAAQAGAAFGLPNRKINIIPHGHYRDCYEPALPKAEARQRLALPVEGRVFLFLGLLRPYKGLEKLLDTWVALERAGELPGATLVVAGKPYTPAYETELRERMGEARSIRFEPRFVKDAEIPVFYGAADLAVLPFARILTSGSLLLAMSFGTPVVAPHLPNLVETLGDDNSSLLYAPHDADGLARLLIEANKAPLGELRQRITRRCDQLSWEGIGQRTADVYRRALRDRAA